MKFDICVGNPPYQGTGNPLYMKITKSIYDNNMDENSVMCMINPTGLVDNNSVGNKTYERNKKLYGPLKLIDFYYDPKIKGTFTSAEIGNDIGIFTYKKVKDEDKSIYSDWVKKIRFGEDFLKNRDIIESIKNVEMIGYSPRFKYIPPEKLDSVKDSYGDGIYVIMSYNRGNQDKVNGGVKWDWTTIQNSLYLKVYNNLSNRGQSIMNFDDSFDEAVKFIKWINTDFMMFFIKYYKIHMKNQPVMFKRLPLPPETDDFSDESLMEKFGLTKDQMEHIHKVMRDFGWKTKTNSYFVSEYKKVGYRMPSIELDGTEETLLKFIEELNRINDGVDASSYVPEEEEEQEEYSEIEYAEPEDSSPSGSEPSKPIVDY